MMGIFGAIPAVMVAKRKRANQENRNLAAAMGVSPSSSPGNNAEVEGAREEDGSSLSYRINQWNETFFQPRGLMIRIDMPFDDTAIEDGLGVAVASSSPASSRKSSVSSTGRDDSQKTRYKVRNRCRIVIIPLNERPQSVLSQATTLAGESPYIPAVYE